VPDGETYAVGFSTVGGPPSANADLKAIVYKQVKQVNRQIVLVAFMLLTSPMRGDPKAAVGLPSDQQSFRGAGNGG
jgi:hypothetical protein